jgi:acid phosphatase
MRGEEEDLGLLWVKHAAEYEALSLQAYRAAEKDLAGFVEDTSWSALPWQQDAADLPPAVILDVDETVVSNIDFQRAFEPPFTNRKHYEWNRDNDALPVRGVASFIRKARAAGVTVFFVTNRPCAAIGDDACPQRAVTIGDIADTGIDTDAEHVLLSQERGWTREKSTRRAYVAENHRVIMLFGDDLGDFLPCIRSKIYTPCRKAATAASRSRDVEEHRDYWGAGWYVLPNPMHGSWTSAH